MSVCLNESKIITKSGTFTLNRKYNWYELNLDYEIDLELDKDSMNTCQVAFNTFKQYEDKLTDFIEKISKYAVETLFEDASEWQEDNGVKLTKDKFMESISITNLMFYEDGTIDAYFDDGDLFWGHCIIVNVDENGNMKDAYIAG